MMSSILPSVEVPNFETENRTALPSKTYSIDIDTGDIKGKIDGLEAVKQAILKIINTGRFKHPIYSYNYGCEIHDLIGMDLTNGFLMAELERMIKEAVEYDDRVDTVHSFNITTNEDNIYISFALKLKQKLPTVRLIDRRIKRRETAHG